MNNKNIILYFFILASFTVKVSFHQYFVVHTHTLFALCNGKIMTSFRGRQSVSLLSDDQHWKRGCIYLYLYEMICSVITVQDVGGYDIISYIILYYSPHSK